MAGVGRPTAPSPLNAAVDVLNGRCGRRLIGYGQCGDPGGYVGAKIAYGRIPAPEDGMRLGDYADGAWMFIVTCDTCGRQARVDSAEVLTHPRTHPRMRVAALAILLHCRDCRHRTARIDPVARLPTQAFVAGMI